MITTSPMPFKEALQSREIKTLLPTTGRTAELSQLDTAIKMRAMFSATVASVEHLQKIDDLVNAILTGQIDEAGARLQIKEYLADIGFQPDSEVQGGLQDLSSTPRIDVQLDTNVDVALGAGWYEQGQDPMILDTWPAQELVRFAVPKGGVKAERDWHARWEKAGGKFYDGRMIALKSDPVWSRLGDPGLFPDGLGNLYPPFAFNSWMRVIDISRDEAEAVGLDIPANVELLPQPLDLNADLQATPDVRSGWLKQMLKDSGLGDFEGDTFVFSGGDK